MAKQPNLLATRKVTLSVTPQMYAYLGDLVLTGLYGKNHAEAAESIVREELRRLVRDRHLESVPSAPQAHPGRSRTTNKEKEK